MHGVANKLFRRLAAQNAAARLVITGTRQTFVAAFHATRHTANGYVGIQRIAPSYLAEGHDRCQLRSSAVNTMLDFPDNLESWRSFLAAADPRLWNSLSVIHLRQPNLSLGQF